MCGINGIWGLQDKELSAAKVRAMNGSLAHRGPDDEGTYVQEGIALGHRRLSIIDLSAAGHQPMTFDEGRFTIVYNGELYNYRELKFDLQRAPSGSGGGFIFRTNTDTEVILAAYARWGSACLDRFNGMFAFAIWDAQEKKLFIARDRLGIKPLYYYHTGDILVFSSELRSLLSSALVPKKLDRYALTDYLRYQTVHAPATIIKDVKMLLPGHFMVAGGKDLAISEYWSAAKKPDQNTAQKPYERVCSEIQALFYKAVERRLVADVPFGAFLSGGIDSSAVVGAMSRVSGTKVKTFLVTFREKEFSEAKYAKLISGRFGTDHHEILLKPEEFLAQLPRALDAMDHPSGDGPNTYIVSKETKRAGITMALSGLGGDELFAGYNVFERMARLQRKGWLNLVPAFARAAAAAGYARMRPGVASDKLYELMSLDRLDFRSVYPLMRKVLTEKRIAGLIATRQLDDNAVQRIVSAKLPFDRSSHYLSLVSFAELSTYMQNTLLRDTDQMSMAHALEVRVPFLDYTLVEYVLSVPDKYKYPYTPKKLLTDALGDLLPADIIHRPKMGFTLPWESWMRGELRGFCADQLSWLRDSGILAGAEVERLWNDFIKGHPGVPWSRVWHIVVLAHWLKKNNIER
ncbi:MAG: asparagine synthase (glutamine-hydrolyzing) [Bacteroidota bacterium]